MQIKRFEAADMTEALRLVKRAFGDDAVILSAKEAKPRGFFGAWKKKQVEITAATDYPLDQVEDENEFTGLLSRQLDAINAADRVSLSTTPPPSGPFTNVHRPVVSRKERTEGTVGSERKKSVSFAPDPAFAGRWPVKDKNQAHSGSIQKGGSGKGDDVFTPEPDSALLRAEPFTNRRDKRQVIALVGPPGAGKSSTLAKLAWHCRVVEQQTVGLISLDRYRMAANSLLERFARIVNLKLFVIQDVDGLQSALNELTDADVILIDTPGVGRGDRSMMETVRLLLKAAAPDEIHLVLNATVREPVLAAAAENFTSIDPNRLLFTHLDECDSRPVSSQLLKMIRLPSAFLADGVDLYENLKIATPERLASLASNKAHDGGRVTVFPGKENRLRVQTKGDSNGSVSARFLANRNSELFHDPACKSVKRINAENIIAFDSIEQAISDGFKPCRACCSVDMIRKIASGSVAFQRAKAM
jgi:flagellar biosynthesis protein FlhF